MSCKTAESTRFEPPYEAIDPEQWAEPGEEDAVSIHTAALICDDPEVCIRSVLRARRALMGKEAILSASGLALCLLQRAQRTQSGIRLYPSGRWC